MCKSENMPRGAAYSAAKLAPSVFRSSLARGSCSKGTMYIVSKHPITSDCPQKVGQAIGETNLLRRRWRGDALSPHDQTAIQTKLQALHTNGQWLACDCTGGGPRPPVFSVASRSSRGQTTYFLRRMTDRAPHLISCPFAFEETQDHGPDSSGSTEGVGTDERQPDFLTPELEAGGLGTKPRAPRDAGSTGSSHSQRLEPLARRLFWLLQKAELNQFIRTNGPPDKLALLDYAKSVSLAAGIQLRDVLYCNDAAWTNAWMDAAFHKCAQHKLRQQAWWICPVDQIDVETRRGRLHDTKTEVQIEGRLSVFGGNTAAVRFPMLMIAVVTKEGSHVGVSQAYCHPIQREHIWCPVDSDLERAALATIAHSMEWLQREKGIRLAGLKPLFEWNETGTRPDFVLTHEASGAHLIIETMGFDDADYQERKVRTVGKLQAFQVYEDKRATDTEADSHLRSEIARWAIRLAAKPPRRQLAG